MDKMRMESVDITDKNIEKIGALFPNVITEATDKSGKLIKAINFELLKQELSKEIIDGDEAYEFTWVGKKAAIVEANKPIRKTLRPCKEESVNWDTTENLYVEGDNLEVLKLLQESYLGKVKMIYIDPPYNTGNDFIYDDDFKQSQDDYDEGSGAVDENGDRMFKNTDSNGRFHSDWCSMIYSRLSLARNLLSNDGCIFISIDDKELQNLKRCCDEIFGEKNYIGQIVVPKGTTTGQDAHDMGSSVDYLLSYSKNKQLFQLKGLELDEKDKKRFNLVDEKGHYSTLQLRKTGKNDRREDRPNLYYGIVTPEGETVFPVGPGGYESCWRADENTYKKWLKENLIVWNQTDKGLMPYVKYYLEGRTKQVSNLWTDIEGNKKASITVRELFGSSVFDNPKPVGLIQKIITISTDDESLILDFFSGSATSAHAVMQLNAEDGGRRRFIMVQLPEKCDEKTEAYKAGYKNICEIGKERIRRAAKKIHEEHPDAKFDDGFRVLKVDESNMTDVYYSADTYDQNMLDQLESNIKADRTDLDLLFGCLLEWGLPLSMPYTSEEIEGCAIHTYNDGDLIACFNNDIPESVIKEIAKRKPLRAVFRDSGFKGSPEKINVGETFKLLSPDTRVKII